MQDTRAETNPLYNANRLKLGIFGTNVSNGCAISTAPDAFETSWPNTLAIAAAADRMGLEALVPVARWKKIMPMLEAAGLRGRAKVAA